VKDLNFFAFDADEVSVIIDALDKRSAGNMGNRKEALATLSALTKISFSQDGPDDEPMSQLVLRDVVFANREQPGVIAARSHDIAKLLPMRTNGHVVFTVFPDQSMLVWDVERGYGHPGN
jgi:hypothetical protein